MQNTQNQIEELYRFIEELLDFIDSFGDTAKEGRRARKRAMSL
jgi:hypothetical protein